jgi:superfamily II RNA helicase
MTDSDSQPVFVRHRPPPGADADAIFDAFLGAVMDMGIELYPAQEEAIMEVFAGNHVILATPTGSGKSMVALAVHFFALCQGKKAWYTAPIKALASEKFFQLCDLFGPENVAMSTGDATINPGAAITCCTAEVLSNLALREGENAEVDFAVLDEFHYYSDRERGMAWQAPLIALPQTRFLLMSATIGECPQVEKTLNQHAMAQVRTVRSQERPVPLEFSYKEKPLHETLATLVHEGKAPIYLVNFTQREAAEEAGNLMSVNFCSKEEKKAISAAVGDFRFDSAYGRDMKRFVHHGIGLHHAGLLPKYRLLVEKLAQEGHLKVISGTDTLGVGVNVPIRTVVFSKLCKFDGEKVGILSVRDFQQIAGRAGRKGFDDRGWVVCQAPEHVIENLRLEQKAGDDPKKKRKLVKKKPPERGYVHFDEKTFHRLRDSLPESLQSRFSMTHAVLLNLLQGGEGQKDGGYGQAVQLIAHSHENAKKRKAHRKRAAQLFKSLVGAGVIEVVKNQAQGTRIVFNQDLQQDFSLNHALSLYLVETLSRLNPEDEEYALDVLTLVESILENPRLILKKQLDKLRGDKVAELKAAGVEYDKRMEELEKLDYPKPNADFIYETFNAFAEKHPWVGAENIRPKSIARQMAESFMSFRDTIGSLGLQRSEGLLLRHLNQACKTLMQTVPTSHRTDEVEDLIAWLRTLLARVDSSLVEEWEEMLNPSAAEPGHEKAVAMWPEDPDVDERAFRARVRAEMHTLVAALSRKNWEDAAAALRPGDDSQDSWGADELQAGLEPFFEEYETLIMDARARHADKTLLEKRGPRIWDVQQVLVDPQGDNLWMIHGQIDLSDGIRPEVPLVRLVRVGT